MLRTYVSVAVVFLQTDWTRSDNQIWHRSRLTRLPLSSTQQSIAYNSTPFTFIPPVHKKQAKQNKLMLLERPTVLIITRINYNATTQTQTRDGSQYHAATEPHPRHRHGS